VEEIEPWKKAKEYLDNFKEHQEEDFVQFFYYNELNEEIWELEKERQREYEEKVSKAIRVRTAHRRKRNEKIIVKIS
jgi:translation initiation factor 1 (eIF-1/SUI1)